MWRLNAAAQELEEAKRGLEQVYNSEVFGSKTERSKEREERLNALRHWQKMFLDGTVHDQHAEFIADVLAEKEEQLGGTKHE